MELVSGRTLREILHAEGAVGPERAVAWTRGVLEALEHAHEEGIANGWGFTVLRLWRSAFGEWPHDTGVYVAFCLSLLAALSLRFGFRGERTPARALADINILCLTFLFLASPEFPWYVLLVVPFLAVAETAAGWTLTVGVFALYAITQGYQTVSYETRADLLAMAVLAAALAGASRRLHPAPPRLP